MDILADQFAQNKPGQFLEEHDLETLERLKLYLDDLYYNNGDSGVSDLRYDLLKDYLIKKNVKLAIGTKMRDGENRVELPYWMGGAAKITPDDTNAHAKWLKKNAADRYCVSEKLDGISGLIVFEPDSLVRIYTRGDSTTGADISYLQSYLRLPRVKRPIVVRGEFIIRRKVFEQKYAGTYKNPRNMVAGLLGAKTSREGLTNVDFAAYEIVSDTAPKIAEQLKILIDLGFTTVEYKVVSSITIPILVNLLNTMKKQSVYDIDGIVVQSNVPYDRSTDPEPDYMFAFKMNSDDDIHDTTVKEIEWNVSKWGQLKPVAIVEPIQLRDITLQRATAHNAAYVEKNNLGPGAVIRVVRSKDVIPYIVSIVKPAKEPQMPSIAYEWDKNHVNVVVSKGQDAEDDQDTKSTMCVKLIAGFFSKLGIKHVSDSTVAKMYDHGLDNLFKILEAKLSTLAKIPSFPAERTYTNIHEGLKKGIKIPTALGASGIFGFGIGERRMEALFLDVPNLLEMHKESEKVIKHRILQVEGFSDITAEKIATNLKYGDQFIKKLSKFATFVKEERVSSSLVGEKFVMSGFRDKELEAEIKKRGGQTTTTVTGKTTGLIVSDKNGAVTGKVAKAQENGVKVYSKDEFIKKYIR